MRAILFFVIITATVVLGLGLIEILLLRLLNRDWWEKKIVRRLAWSLPVVGLCSLILVGVGGYYRLDWLTFPSAALGGTALILEVSLMLSLPVSGLIHLLNRGLDYLSRKRGKTGLSQAPDHSRRMFMKGAAAAVPLATIGLATVGVGRSFATARVYKKSIAIENLPLGLVGLRILHLSDLHLRHYVTADDLAAVLERAESLRPDIILITGDIADDLTQLPDALRLIDEMRAPLGAFASLGNHEYFRGLQEVHRIFDRSAVSLMVNEGIKLSHQATPLFIGGIDDPRYMSGATPGFFERCLDTTLAASSGGDTIVLMSHRPDAFNYTPDYGVHLTLAGHTHGGQMGLFGRSLFESYVPKSYLWGHYQTAESHLYTSSGVGHWFPFRLGCPSEAPVIELVRS
jgi:predicted MPP superfamily phosphohydrolase